MVKDENQVVKEVMKKQANDENSMMALTQYLAIAKRRLSLIILCAMAVTAIVGIVVKRMPNQYRAETVILVDPQQVPNNYVASTVSSNISDRLSTLQQEVTSPSRLKRLIDSEHLFTEMRKMHTDQEVIAAMQQGITVQILESGGHGSNSAFKVAFTGKDPRDVAKIANSLAEMFISENLKVRERQSYGTAEFLDDELKRTKEQLDAKQTALNDVKSKYMLDLPESKQYHLEELTTLRAQLQASQDRVNQAQQQKVYLQSLTTTQAPTVDLDSGNEGDSVYAPQINKLEAQLSSLKAHYGEKHPDVRKLAAQLNDLKAKQKTAAQDGTLEAPPVIQEAGSPRAKSKNPVLAAQLQKLDDEIEREKNQQKELQQQIAFHTSKLEKIPVFEQRISGMLWDYDSLRAHYSELESKKLSADMSSALETHEKGERFVVLDRAQVPTHPYSPKRALITIAALLAGLALGLGLGVAIEISEGAVHTRSDLADLIGDTPILADIPKISTSGEIMRRRFRLGAAYLATAVGSVVAGLAISYFTNKTF